MKNISLSILAAITAFVLIMAALIWRFNHRNLLDNTVERKVTVPAVVTLNKHEYAKSQIRPKFGQPIKKFTLTAMESKLEISRGLSLPVWTFNGSVPGPEIRVTQGDYVQVELRNVLATPVTIHWHGYPLLSSMDGVPGINQDSVKPGEVFTYEFSADAPGTYWYHSHQEGAEQVDKGLYGVLIVESKEVDRIDRDYSLILDEWMGDPSQDMEAMPGMPSQNDTASTDMADMSSDTGEAGIPTAYQDGVTDIEDEQMMSSAYNIYTVNGKSGALIESLEVEKGDVVRLRLLNAGYRSHGIHIPGQEIKVVSTDGQDIVGAGLVKDKVLVIAPGERYDIDFKVTSDESFIIDAHDTNPFSNQLKIPVRVAGTEGNPVIVDETKDLPVFDFMNYGIPAKGRFVLDQKYDVDYSVTLGTRAEGSKLSYTINGKVFTELPSLKIKTGDTVKFTFDNNTMVDHPMHLHGHFFQVLSRNGEPLSGAAIIKDTLLVRPGEQYVVAFLADNPGRWVQHCHELHHAAAGMMQKIEYVDYQPNYIPDPNNPANKPE